MNRINGKRYIGISIDPEQRWGLNGNGYKCSHYFYSAIQKYGWENFDQYLLETGLSDEEAYEREIYYIEKYDTTNPEKGYNLSNGGQGGKVWGVHPLSVPVKVTATDGNTLEFPTIKSCGEYFGIPVRTMQNIVHRKQPFEMNNRNRGKPQYESIEGFYFEKES